MLIRKMAEKKLQELDKKLEALDSYISDVEMEINELEKRIGPDISSERNYKNRYPEEYWSCCKEIARLRGYVLVKENKKYKKLLKKYNALISKGLGKDSEDQNEETL